MVLIPRSLYKREKRSSPHSWTYAASEDRQHSMPGGTGSPSGSRGLTGTVWRSNCGTRAGSEGSGAQRGGR